MRKACSQLVNGCRPARSPLLSIAGTFGLASYTFSKRLRELSIRAALGALAKQILSAALGRMLILLANGSAVGILLGVAASRILSAIVYQASAQDPFVLAAVVFTLLLTGTLSVAGSAAMPNGRCRPSAFGM